MVPAMHADPAHAPHLAAVIPFALLLAAIAILPLAAPHAWESNKNKLIVSAGLAIPVAIYVLTREPIALVHSLVEYVSFLALLGSLYVISGGIHVSGDLEGRPTTNVLFMIAGAVLANVVGTTGASMLLIRTLLRTNHQRHVRAHIPVFFILIVSNCGGLLTPLGDPPLFLGYLRGVPFTFTFSLWREWLLTVGYLSTLFFVVDSIQYGREARADLARDARERVPLRVEGGANGILLAAVMVAVFFPTPVRELAMIGLAVFSVALTDRTSREKNSFTYGPILEVAVLFLGIFVTMIPALELLAIHGSELGLREPWHFFLTTGALSSVLDNAPTYLTFLSAAQGLGLADEVVGVPASILSAISLGAVLMGANTYIGNGPNFMVKAIAEESKYEMPSFFGYAARAVLILAPVYVAITLMS